VRRLATLKETKEIKERNKETKNKHKELRKTNLEKLAIIRTPHSPISPDNRGSTVSPFIHFLESIMIRHLVF
jgi:hypothetical protein